MTGTPALGVPGICAQCEEYTEELAGTTDGDRALCPHCADSTVSPVTYDDLHAYRCNCGRDEITVVGSLEEQVDLCVGCVRTARQMARIDLDSPSDPAKFTARSPASRGDSPL